MENESQTTDLKGIIVTLVLLSLFSINCFAAVPAEQKTLDINQVAPVAPHQMITQDQVASVIPTDIPNGASDATVGKMVMDKALKSALKSDFVKGSSVGQTAQNLKDGINTEMAIGGSPTDPTAVQHKFKMKLDPVQTRAKLQYVGYINASATYDSGDAKFEITEDFKTYKLNLSHTSNETEDLSLVQVQWQW